MANTRSAGKRSRQSLKRATQNRGARTRLRTLEKRNRAEAKPTAEQVHGLISALDKAAKRGLIHRNAANRRKARLNALLTGQKARK